MSVSSFEGAESCSRREISLSRLFSVFSVPSSGSSTSESLSFSRASRCWTTDSSSGRRTLAHPGKRHEPLVFFLNGAERRIQLAGGIRQALGQGHGFRINGPELLHPVLEQRSPDILRRIGCGFRRARGRIRFLSGCRGSIRKGRARQGKAQAKKQGNKSEAFIQRRSVRLEYVRRFRNIPRDPSARQPLRM